MTHEFDGTSMARSLPPPFTHSLSLSDFRFRFSERGVNAKLTVN